MQFLCKETGCYELYSQCIKYATTNKALCFFENPPGTCMFLWRNKLLLTKVNLKHINGYIRVLWDHWQNLLQFLGESPGSNVFDSTDSEMSPNYYYFFKYRWTGTCKYYIVVIHCIKLDWINIFFLNNLFCVKIYPWFQHFTILFFSM